AAGDIKAFGMGINDNDGLENVASRFDLDFCLVAMPYTMLDHASLHRGMADLQRRGISAIIGTPFASGILATGSKGAAQYAYGKASPEIQAKVRGMEAVCAAHGVALPAAAMQFALAHPIAAAIIPGAARPEEVVQNVASLEQAIPPEFWRDLRAQGLISRDAPVPDPGRLTR
ncbi:MAG: aldo/keto reductase, partial [Candidatus Saccharibacteria bacterium]|nr:aldo/keto reductase [Pseudorhodobacter sp.]